MRAMAYTSNAEATPVFRIPPPSVDPTLATAAPAKMDLHEQSRVSAAGHRAKRMFPGPIGELLHREIDAWAHWGYRIDQSGLLPRVVDHIMTAVEDHP